MKRGIFLLATLFLLNGCGEDEAIQRLTAQKEALESQVAQLQGEARKFRDSHETLRVLGEKLEGIRARIVTNHGKIELKLFPDQAPLHCFNFITRAESGFYDGTQFHRVMPSFMIQGGDPNTKRGDIESYGLGAPIAMIPHEFNDTPHTPGTLSMARSPNLSAGAGSQFFIMHGTAPHLNRQYTAFGKVTSGMAVVDKIASLPTGRRKSDLPDTPVTIKTIEVFR